MTLETYQQVLFKVGEDLSRLLDTSGSISCDDLTQILRNSQGVNENLITEVPTFLSQANLPRQTFQGQAFSQFPLTILNSNGINLDLYFWKDAHTNIHDHNFHGAFKILKGNYHQLRFAFEVTDVPFEWLSVGNLKVIANEVLKAGDVVQIDPGDKFIHLTHHHDGVCVTACLRTEERSGPIHAYIPPSLRLTYNQWDQKELKLLDFIYFSLFSQDGLSSGIPEVLDQLEGWILVQLIFSFNVPAWTANPQLKEYCFDSLERRYPNAEWMKEIQKCRRMEQLNTIKFNDMFKT
jgi:hypothetical protein